MPHNQRAGHGPVVLDIGGQIGALIVSMPHTLAGAEIGIRAVQSAQPIDPNRHVAVVGRPTGPSTTYAAVFDGLPEGSYELYERPDQPPRLSAQVTGGAVTHTAWPTPGHTGPPSTRHNPGRSDVRHPDDQP
jgi:hypothetical protein